MNMNLMMQQAQKLQKELEQKIKNFEKQTYEYNYKNNSIVLQITGEFKIIKLTINKVLIDPTDPIFLQDMVIEAINMAITDLRQEKAKIEKSVKQGF